MAAKKSSNSSSRPKPVSARRSVTSERRTSSNRYGRGGKIKK